MMPVFFTAGKYCFSKTQLFSGVSCVGADSGTVTLIFTLKALSLKKGRR